MLPGALTFLIICTTTARNTKSGGPSAGLTRPAPAPACVVFSGFFGRLPNLKIVTHHMGGMVPSARGASVTDGISSARELSDSDYGQLLRTMKKRPVDYFKMFYADTARFGAAAGTRCGLEFFGLDQGVFASDVAFEPSPGLYTRETIRCIEALGLNEVDKERIYAGNARRLLRLEKSQGAA